MSNLNWCFLFLIIPFFIKGQIGADTTIDSLFRLLDTPTIDMSPEDRMSIANRYYQSHPELSNAYAESALSSKFAEESIQFRSKALIDYGYNLNKQGEIDRALDYLNRGLDMAHSSGDTVNIIKARNSLGIYYNDRGDNVYASRQYIQALELARLVKDTFQIIRPHVNLAGLYNEQNRPEKSISIGKAGIELARAIGELRGEGFLCNNIAVAYLSQDQFSEAKPYLDRALEISTLRDDKETMARNHSNLCNVYRELGDLNQAEFHCLLANEFLEPLRNPRSKLLHAINFGRLLSEQGQIEEALSQANFAKEMGLRNSLNIHLNEVYQLFYELYKKKNEFKKALSMLEVYSEQRYGSLNAKNTAQVMAAEESYNSLLEQNTILENRTKMVSLENENSNSNYQRNLAIVLSTILGVMGLVLLWRYKIQRSLSNELKERNAEIEEKQIELNVALEQKETLLKEIHHRVKNNLQIISSLLNLQSKKIKDSVVLESIEEGKNRVEAMSLIHQNLYQSDRFTSIEMNSYINQLMTHLASSFNFDSDDIKYKVDTNGIDLDIDTAIPIGLIINELVTNAAKHAFTNKDFGNIKVVLVELRDNRYKLIVQDDGIGIDPDIDYSKLKSLGFRLVNTLGVKQLNGDLKVESDYGSKMTLLFSSIQNQEQ